MFKSTRTQFTKGLARRITWQVSAGSTGNSVAMMLARLGVGAVVPRGEVVYQTHDKVEQSPHEFSPESSDHKRVKHPLFSPHKVLAWNTMMQASKEVRDPAGKILKPAKTAFRHLEEDDPIYTQRWQRNLMVLRDELADPNIAMICLQEAPIGEQLELFKQFITDNFPSEWKLTRKEVICDSTPWGVFTLINLNKLKLIEVNLNHDLTQGNPFRDADIRCRTFMVQHVGLHPTKFTNLHLPHRGSEEAFKAYMKRVIAELVQHGLNDKTFEHQLLGDWNLEPHQMIEWIKEMVDSEKQKMPKGLEFPFNFSVKCVSSKDGHLKQEGYTLTVDHLLSLEVKPAEQYEFTAKIEIRPELMAYGATMATLMMTTVAAFRSRRSKEEPQQESIAVADPNDDESSPLYPSPFAGW